MSDLVSTRDRVRVLFAALHESGCGAQNGHAVPSSECLQLRC